MQGDGTGMTGTQSAMDGNSGGTEAAALVDNLKSAARDVADTAKDSVQELKGDLDERASGTVNERKHALADSLESVVSALRAAESALRDDRQESLATYSSSLASYVERSAGYLRNNDLSGLMNDLQRVGRENTGAFMGGTFVAGAALGRFLRASAPEQGMENSSTSMQGAGSSSMQGDSASMSSYSTSSAQRDTRPSSMNDGSNDGAMR